MDAGHLNQRAHRAKKTYNNRNVSNKLYRLEVSLVVDSFKEIAWET